MGSASVDQVGRPRPGDRLLACIARQGSAAHPYASSAVLLKGPDAARNLSDAVHLLGILHGRYPGVVDHAADRCLDDAPRNWFRTALGRFGEERAFLARLSVAAGPVPGTPGASGTQSAVLAQRHAIETLAKSERKGCALGTALAVVADWRAIRFVLDAAAERFDVDNPPFTLGDHASIRALVEASVTTNPVERALLFGAEQVAIQHFGLWDLLEARQQARLGA